MTDFDEQLLPDWEHSLSDQIGLLVEAAVAVGTATDQLEPPALVEQVVSRLMLDHDIAPANRAKVKQAGATIVRRLLLDYARQRAKNRQTDAGGDRDSGLRLSTDVSDSAVDLLELDYALEKLAVHNPRAAQVVELKFYGGLLAQEIAELLGISQRSVNHDWRFAKAWLYRELTDTSAQDTDAPMEPAIIDDERDEDRTGQGSERAKTSGASAEALASGLDEAFDLPYHVWVRGISNGVATYSETLRMIDDFFQLSLIVSGLDIAKEANQQPDHRIVAALSTWPLQWLNGQTTESPQSAWSGAGLIQQDLLAMRGDASSHLDMVLAVSKINQGSLEILGEIVTGPDTRAFVVSCLSNLTTAGVVTAIARWKDVVRFASWASSKLLATQQTARLSFLVSLQVFDSVSNIKRKATTAERALVLEYLQRLERLAELKERASKSDQTQGKPERLEFRASHEDDDPLVFRGYD